MSDADQVLAALLWDVPRLREFSKSGRDFVEAMSGDARDWWQSDVYGDDILGRAARAAAHERADELEEAADGYRSLIAEPRPWPRLLGLMLSAWSAGAIGRPEESIENALNAAREIDVDDEIRARLCAKVATYFFDRGQRERGAEVLEEAIALAPDGSRLRSRLALEGLNAGLRFEGPLPTSDQAPPPPDPLVDYPWIEYEALEGAQRTLKAEVERRGLRAWTWQIKLGATAPYSEVITADVTATWAGALWLRRPIRTQLGAHLLTGGSSSPRQWAYGCVMWALGGGRNAARIYGYAEPNLDAEGVEFILREVSQGEIRGSGQFLSIAAEAWDAIPDDTFLWVIDQAEPVARDHPLDREVHGLWAAYAARFPDRWLADFRERPEEIRVVLLESLGTGALSHLSQPAKAAVFESAWRQLQEAELPDLQIMRIAAETAAPEQRSEVARAVGEKARPSDLAHLLYELEDLSLPRDAVNRAKQALVGAVHRQEAEAKSGKISFGAGDARLDLGRLLARVPPDPDAVAVLMDIALALELPGEHILAARNALAVLRKAERLSPDNLEALHSAPDSVGTFPEHAGLSVDLARAKRLQILAPELTEGEAANVAAGCRHPETRVRMISLATCGEAAATAEPASARDPFVWGLIGGLFDPDDEPVASAVASLPYRILEGHPAASRVAADRLLPLLQSGSTMVRVAVAELTSQWMEVSERHEKVLKRAWEESRRDKSWLVRSLRSGA